MYKNYRVIALVPAFNEEKKIGLTLQRLTHLAEKSGIDEILTIDDASTDSTAEVARTHGATVLTFPRRSGVGAALRAGLEYAAQHRYDLAVILAGNNKDEPAEIPILLDPICDLGFDFVIGSRHIVGGRCGGMPLYRRLATRIHPWLLGLTTGKRLTESTNGFRAIRLSMLTDTRINLRQRWLDSYGLEVYLLWKVLTLGYRHMEVPCTKIYPSRDVGYTKMKPVLGWWNILRPILLLGLRLRH